MATYNFLVNTGVAQHFLIKEIEAAIAVSITSWRSKREGSGKRFYITTDSALSGGQIASLNAAVSAHTPVRTDAQEIAYQETRVANRKASLKSALDALENDWDATPSNYTDVQANVALVRKYILLEKRDKNV